MKRHLFIVIVLYKQNAEESKSYQSIRGELVEGDTVLFVDNSPKSHPIPSSISYTIISTHFPDNPGVSLAYNTAFRLAEEHGYEAVLLVDQDTIFPNNGLAGYRLAVIRPDTVIAPLVFSGKQLISPYLLRYHRPWYLNNIYPGIQNFRNLGLINSGALVPITLSKLVGGYNNDIPLDWSDVDFFERLANVGAKLTLIDVKLQQSLSVDEASTMSTFRFSTYLKGARVLSKQRLSARCWLMFWTFLKALKFAIKTKSLNWLSVWFKTFILPTR